MLILISNCVYINENRDDGIISIKINAETCSEILIMGKTPLLMIEMTYFSAYAEIETVNTDYHGPILLI